MRLLIVEDDATIADFVRTDSSRRGLPSMSRPKAVKDSNSRSVGVTTRLSSTSCCRRSMGSRSSIGCAREACARPVLILSARRTVDDRVRGLQAGGDDYLTKPFAFAELLARVQALIRRATGATEPTRLVVGDLSLDLLTRRAERGGSALDLRPREFALLEYLMRNPGRVLTKTMILSHVWGYNFNPGHERGRRARIASARKDRT